MATAESTASESRESPVKEPARPLDELLGNRSKPFRDWREEREYLRRKWGPQGKRIQPEKPKRDSSPGAGP